MVSILPKRAPIIFGFPLHQEEPGEVPWPSYPDLLNSLVA